MGRRNWLVATTVCLAAVLVCPGMAEAATLRMEGGVWRYVGGAEDNAVTVREEGRQFVFVDTAVTSFGRLPAGCAPEPVEAGYGVRCDAPGRQTLRFDLDGGDDSITAWDVSRRFTQIAEVGDGDDSVAPGDGDDRVTGGAGADTLYGGYGDDLIDSGGGSDFVHGNAGSDQISTGAEFDFVFGDGGNDVIDAGGTFDYIFGGGGHDVIDAGAGNDFASGDGGDDRIAGSAGDDELSGGGGVDRLDGGTGNDLLRARDSKPDSLTCGSGQDIARVDAGEVDQARRDCETVREADTTPTEPADQDATPRR